MKTAGVAVRAFVAGAAGTAGALALLGGLIVWGVKAIRRDVDSLIGPFTPPERPWRSRPDTED